MIQRIDRRLWLACILAAGCWRGDPAPVPAGFAGGDTPVAGGGGNHPALGLISAAPSADAVRLHWRATELPVDAPAAALFVGPVPGSPLAAPPVPIDTADRELTLANLSPDTAYTATLAFDDGAGAWVPAGPELSFRTRSPIFVRSGADAKTADGLSPGTAWPTLALGIAHAQAEGGGNLWLSGEFSDTAAHVPAEVDLYGGFDGAFSLAARDPISGATFLVAGSTSSVLTLDRADGSVAVVDGLRIDGMGISDACVDVDQRRSDIRSVGVGGASRGFRLRSFEIDSPTVASMVRCTAQFCSAGGTSIAGPFDVLLDDCEMARNGQEGLTADDLVGLTGKVSRVYARDCVFRDNVSEGLDVDFVTSGQAGSGRWVVRLEDCEFIDNGSDGCLLDCDYEGEPGWSSRLEIHGCVARGNAEAGFHLDVDAQATSHIFRTTSASNRGDGVLISSETAPGTVLIDASALFGNRGAGARTEMGNVGVLVTHSVVGGNGAGGIVRGVAPTQATSSIAYLQPSPWPGSAASFTAMTPSPPTFAVAPQAWYEVQAYQGSTATLGSMPGFGSGATVELAAEGVARLVASVSGSAVVLENGPASLVTPSTLAWFDGASVALDWRLDPASPAIGAGLATQGGPARDAGPFGSTAGGTPTRLDTVPEEVFRLAEITPSWTQPISPAATLVATFDGGLLDVATAAGGIDAVDGGGAPIALGVATAGTVIVLTPPAGGWPTGTRLLVFDSLRSTDGRALSASVAIPLSVSP